MTAALLTIQEAAERLGVSASTARRLIADGYWLDHETCYWIPVGVSLDVPDAKN